MRYPTLRLLCCCTARGERGGDGVGWLGMGPNRIESKGIWEHVHDFQSGSKSIHFGWKGHLIVFLMGS